MSILINACIVIMRKLIIILFFYLCTNKCFCLSYNNCIIILILVSSNESWFLWAKNIFGYIWWVSVNILKIYKLIVSMHETTFYRITFDNHILSLQKVSHSHVLLDVACCILSTSCKYWRTSLSENITGMKIRKRMIKISVSRSSILIGRCKKNECLDGFT